MDLSGDDAISATNDDASICKYQTVSGGYYQDEFIEYLLPLKLKRSSKKTPEIKLGYYVRSAAIAYLVERYTSSHRDAQIISLGAGYDSLYWRLKSQNFIGTNPESQVKYVEIDMSTVVAHKIMNIKRHSQLKESLIKPRYKGECLYSEDYNLIAYDLRQVQKDSLRQRLIEECALDLRKPVLCIAECVLVYMPKKDSDSLIGWFNDICSNLTIINYEQCNMDDRFGGIMLANLNERHCDLLGVDACKSLDSQTDRFKSNGLNYTKGWTMTQIYKEEYNQNSLRRAEELEILDEKELLFQLLDHYCIVIGSKSPIDWAENPSHYWLSEISEIEIQTTV